MLSSAVRNLASRDICEVFLKRDCLALAVHIKHGVPLRKVLVDLGGVNTRIALLCVHEALEWTHRLRL